MPPLVARGAGSFIRLLHFQRPDGLCNVETQLLLRLVHVQLEFLLSILLARRYEAKSHAIYKFF